MSKRFALAGNPNCGKTMLFNQLTGSTAHVGNWPGVTIDQKIGRYKRGAEEIEIVDLPGIYSLSPYTPEEIITRTYILEDAPDLIINIVDATNLERNLYLTTQLMETGCPVVVALNMMDEVRSKGDSIDVARLEHALGVPVVGISALRGEGLDILMREAIAASNNIRTPDSVLLFTPMGKEISRMTELFKENGVPQPMFSAIKALESDPLVMEYPSVKSLKAEIDASVEALNRVVTDIEATMADSRYKHITSNYSPLYEHHIHHHGRYHQREHRRNRSDRIDNLLTHKILGLPIFLGIMMLMFHFTFTESLFGLGIPGPGVFLQGLMEELIGFASGGIEFILESLGASEWVFGLVMEGMVVGVGAVLSFIPPILVIFFFLSILEDSGYMARAAFIMDRLLRRFGLSGKSFIPMLMGFGCSVPAIMGTRTLESERDRRLTMMLIPFMSCGAKLPIYTIFAAALFEKHADIMVLGIYVIGITTAVVAGIILKKVVFKGEAIPFVMELPTYRMPAPKSLFINIWQKFREYLVRAGTIILASTIVIWFLANFDFTFHMVEANSKASIIGTIGSAIQFVFRPLGFAPGPDGWKSVVAIFTGLVAKEIVVSTLGILYNPAVGGDVLADEGAQGALVAILATTFSPLAALSFMAFNLLSVPCMAAVGALRGEMRSGKWFWGTIAFWFCTAWIVSFLIFNVGTLFGF